MQHQGGLFGTTVDESTVEEAALTFNENACPGRTLLQTRMTWKELLRMYSKNAGARTSADRR